MPTQDLTRSLEQSRAEIRMLREQLVEMRKQLAPENIRTYVTAAVEGAMTAAFARLADRDPGQAWFWTAAWQKGEAEAGADIAAGRVTRFDSDEEFVASLRG